MDTTISTRERLEKELTEKLSPFVDECAKRGYPVEDYSVYESIPGVHDIFLVKVGVRWAKGSIEAGHILMKILRESTPKEYNRFIWGVDAELLTDSKMSNAMATAY
ncbi:MAG: hypothetical protein LBU65_08040 [Planctomycetaceae bacterium]|jgi:hypothetical protein|nr:hypothetical protein [Planctomycetaceae bacterium]